MKTRILIIVGIITILAVSIISISLAYNQEIKLATGIIQKDTEHSDLYVGLDTSDPKFEIVGIDYQIHPNVPLIISVEKIGYDMCDPWVAKIIDVSDNSTVWERNYSIGCVSSDPPTQQKFEYSISQENRPIIISEIGNYVFQITIGETYLEKEFVVRNNTAGGTLDRIPHSEEPVSNYEIIPWDDFKNEFHNDAAIFTKDMIQISILEAGKQYYVIQKAEFQASSFGDKDTSVNATIGYAIQYGDQMLRPPMHENATNAEHEEFMKKMNKQREEFPQQSPIANSYDFVVDIENPFYIKFPFVIEEPGQYTRQFYKTTHIFEGPSSSGMGGFVVVDKFSKAVDENGICKNDSFRRLIKHDHSTVACIDSKTAWKLIGRGWGL